MESQDWLQKVLDELVNLAPVAEEDPNDAWRAVVLISRLLGSPSGPTPPAEVLRRLPALLAQAGMPEPEPLLQRLSEELEAEDDPAGPLFDVLLDIDDSLGALTLHGDSALAQALSRRSAELVARFASRVVPLKGFAALRTATLRPGSEAARLWDAVAHARAVLPTEDLQERAPTVRRRRVRVLPLPRESARPHAWTGSAPLALTSPDGETRAWLYEEGGRLRLELRGTPQPPTSARLAVLRREDQGERAATDLPLEVSGRTAYADLGPAVGQGNLLFALLAQAGLPLEEADLHLVVTHDG
ncbi:hypothetical protein [Corallococcus exiguus]|uniref:hypothetical protein n=1 Tax=Corallococcus exiguus TaxID=83462 RepID=UPI0014710BB1|nr:hypothetical protein [Corallococcus exiguus]NNB85292.1 hypothetical protein [Corallococcus exiguus]